MKSVGRMRVLSALAVVVAFSLCPWATGRAAAPNSDTQVMTHLNQVLRWARQWDSADVYLSRLADELYVENGRNLAQQVVKLEFQSAMAQAALIGESSPKPAVSSDSSGNGTTQNIFRSEQRAGDQVQDFQAQLDAVNAKISSARAKDRPALVAQRDTLQSQLQLAQALHDNLAKLTSFMTSAENASGGATELAGRIEALQRANPNTAIAPQGKGANKSGGNSHATAAPRVSNSQNEGLIGQLGELVHFVQSMRALDQLKKDATELQNSTRDLRAPLLVALRTTLQQGQIELTTAAHPASDSNAPSDVATDSTPKPAQGTAPGATPGQNQTTATLQQRQRAMATLIQHFKLLSSATLPLSQELVLVAQSQANLDQLETSLKHDYFSILRSLLLKAVGILIALGLIWLFSELWRRATFRYIKDARRRRQFLVLRRVVTGFCMFIVILLGFVSDFSSLATYAGLITAGIAVALQAVILSVAAYFFLVGRYGVKVGDRVTVVYNGANSVSGDVVDIGLVRFYLMELAGSGINMQPTGRICVFPNSVLFQTQPLFKQMPGTEYAWREIALPLTPDSDGQLAEKELLATVEYMYASYRPLLERQHASIEETLGMHMDTPKPHTRVRFVGSGLEVMVRYPIPLRQAAELDDRMVTEVTDMLKKNPSLHLQAGASPDLRSPVKV